MSEEMESAHGKLSPVDQRMTGERFVGLLVVTLVIALAVIYTIASLKDMDFSWQGMGLAHDPVKHSLESSSF